jgi:hypothetical protein
MANEEPGIQLDWTVAQQDSWEDGCNHGSQTSSSAYTRAIVDGSTSSKEEND